MRGNRCRIGIELKVEGSDGFVVGLTDDGVDGRKRETFDDGVGEGRHDGGGRDRVLSPRGGWLAKPGDGARVFLREQ